MSTLCLNMIVKNESHIIRETLEHLTAILHFDYWVISDTGSSDNTPEIISDFFQEKSIPGEIHHDEWKNFGWNRSQALSYCENKTDYVFFWDADDRFDGSFVLPDLTHDTYFVKFTSVDKSLAYRRKLIVRNNGNYFWRGVLHEFITEHDKNFTTGTIEGNYGVISGRFGARSQLKDKYLLDARALEQALASAEDEDLKPRYAFYCGQSYRDAGMPEKAIEWYLKRAEMGGWKEEAMYSYMQAGLQYEKLNNEALAIHCWLRGMEIQPERAECAYHLARLNRWKGRPMIAMVFAQQAKRVTPPEHGLQVSKAIYSFWIDYEVAHNSQAAGDFMTGKQACQRVLANSAAPDNIRNTCRELIKKYDAAMNSVRN
ncbi:TPA: glycosyltransferase [Citrobacter freundii]|nr:glycosyltransferase [Citrobacter freundii]